MWRKNYKKRHVEKTFTTFYASNVFLQQEYQERRLTKYSELISCLLVAEQNNELLSSPMVVQSLDVKKDSFRHCKKNEELLGRSVIF